MNTTKNRKILSRREL